MVKKNSPVYSQINKKTHLHFRNFSMRGKKKCCFESKKHLLPLYFGNYSSLVSERGVPVLRGFLGNQ